LQKAVDGSVPVSLLERFFDGAVAQLEERHNGIVEVDGSIPFGSTNFRVYNKKWGVHGSTTKSGDWSYA
jgi:hypothetical protein